MTGDKPEEKCPQRQSKNRLEFLKDFNHFRFSFVL